MISKATVGLAIQRNVLLLLTLLGMVLGIGLGVAVRSATPSDDALMWLGLPGQLYMRLLKMMIVPLVVTSVCTGTASLDPKTNGKVSTVAFLFVFITNMIGAILGVFTFIVFKPGIDRVRDNTVEAQTDKQMETQDIFADLLRNIVPDNLFEATFRQSQTKYERSVITGTTDNITGGSAALFTFVKYVGKTDGPNLLGLIFACTLVGVAASSLGDKGKPLLDMLEAATQTVLVIIRWFLWTTPIGVFSLILLSIASVADIASIFRDLGMFIIAVMVALVIHQLIVMPLVLFITTQRNPYKHLLEISQPWIIAFAAASSAVAMPEMLRACELGLNLDKRIVRFAIPFSLAVSANGSAVFIPCSCLFISNISGIPPTAGTMFTIGLLATLSALAIPSVPSSSIVTIVMILTALNIPTDAIALVIAVDFFLDRVRTTNSLVSHTMCAAVTHHLCQNTIRTREHGDEGDVKLTVSTEQRKLFLKEEETTEVVYS